MSKASPTRHTVTFNSEQDSMCVALAKLGQSTASICRETGLSECQVIYRLSKGKRLEENEHGYRVMWRNGEGDLIARLKRDVLGILQAEVQRDLPKKLRLTEPKTVKE